MESQDSGQGACGLSIAFIEVGEQNRGVVTLSLAGLYSQRPLCEQDRLAFVARRCREARGDPVSIRSGAQAWGALFQRMDRHAQAMRFRGESQPLPDGDLDIGVDAVVNSPEIPVALERGHIRLEIAQNAGRQA